MILTDSTGLVAAHGLIEQRDDGMYVCEGTLYPPDMLMVDAEVPPELAGQLLRWTGTSFEVLPPPPPAPPAVPSAITPRQARLALLGAGLLSSVDAAIASLPEPQKSAAQIEWEYATSVERNSPLVQNLTPALGMTPEQVDALFIQGAAL